MALGAKLLRMTGGTIRRERPARDRPVPFPSRPTRILVRRRRRETGHVTPGQRNRTNERDVAGRAGRVGCREVSSSNAVASLAGPDYGKPHRHAWFARFRVAGGARRRPGLASYAMLNVIKAQVRAPWRGARAPSNCLRDFAVVARHTGRLRGPERGAFGLRAAVTSCTRRKQRLVLQMIESAGVWRLNQTRHEQESDHRSPPFLPPGMRRHAAGRLSRR